MKRNKVESILLIAVLALSIQTGSYSAAITDRELDQYYAKNIQEKSTDVIVWKYRVWNGKKQKRRWNVTKSRWEDPAWSLWTFSFAETACSKQKRKGEELWQIKREIQQGFRQFQM